MMRINSITAIQILSFVQRGSAFLPGPTANNPRKLHPVTPPFPRRKSSINLASNVPRHLFGTSLSSSRTKWSYGIIQVYENMCWDDESFGFTRTRNCEHALIENNIDTAPKILFRLDASRYPSVSKARKACRMGEVVIFRRGKHEVLEVEETISLDILNNAATGTDREGHEYRQMFDDLVNANCTIFVASPATIVLPIDIIAIRARIQDSFYPTSATGYIHPPASILNNFSKSIQVIYEDDHLSLVNKPELLTTIGEKRDDLQSALPYLLYPPSKKYWPSRDSPSLPRPVHRLDRRTSGLVLVAKTKRSMLFLSKSFTAREVEKSYMAIVFGSPNVNDFPSLGKEVTESWQIIDYPIDGKPSITLWRSIKSVESSEFGTLTLLLCRPKTGRYHQIRRHLSYCLGTPILGDNKYDKGREEARAARSLGMFLCSNSLEFNFLYSGEEELSSLQADPRVIVKESSAFSSFDEEVLLDPLGDDFDFVTVCIESADHMKDNKVTFRVRIPLPEKFKGIMLS